MLCKNVVLCIDVDETGSKAIVGQIVNVPVDVNNMIRHLPRNLDDDFAINVHIKKKIVHKSTYLKGFVRKRVLCELLEYLVQQPLYKLYDIEIDFDVFRSVTADSESVAGDDNIESMDTERVCDSEIIAARQRTLMWNEDVCLQIAPGQHRVPLNVI
jgi:hypothetical protein